MRRLLILCSMFFLLMNGAAFTQSCVEWDDTTHYQPGERVIHAGNAYEALVNIWYWPPPHPIYWEQVPLMDCYAPDTSTLYLYVNEGGIVSVIIFPDDTVGMFIDTFVTLEFAQSETVTLAAKNFSGNKFDNWFIMSPDSNYHLYSSSIELTVDEWVDSYCSFHELQKCSLTVHLGSNGTLTLDTLPDGTVETFDPADQKSVIFEYYEGSDITLRANPDPGYELIDWGDPANTTTDTVHILFSYNDYEFYTAFDIESELFKLPAQCHSGDHIKIQGRSRFYGKAVIGGDLEERGTIIVKDKRGSVFERCSIEKNRIALEHTNILRNYLYSPAVDGNIVKADSAHVYNTTTADTIVTERTRVDMEEFPDFVFDKNYYLQSIEKAEKYVNNNGRLPRMPSAEEVKGKGVDAADMYSKLMQQTEEAMLYLIQLHKRLNDLESNNK